MNQHIPTAGNNFGIGSFPNRSYIELDYGNSPYQYNQPNNYIGPRNNLTPFLMNCISRMVDSICKSVEVFASMMKGDNQRPSNSKDSCQVCKSDETAQHQQTKQLPVRGEVSFDDANDIQSFA
jgi:hypothetical protein